MFFSLANNSFSEISKAIKQSRNSLILLNIFLRKKELTSFNIENFKTDQLLDAFKIIGKEFLNLVPVATSANGNCFYNAISLCLFSSEEFNLLLRILVIFTFFENEKYFRNLIRYTYGDKLFNQKIEDIARNYNWANEYEIHGMSIALNRPINVYSFNEANKFFQSQQYYANESQLKQKAVSIVHRINHFIALLPTDEQVKIPSPQSNQFNKFLLKNFKSIIDQHF